MKSKPIKYGALSCALAFSLFGNQAKAAVASDLDSILSAVGSVHFTSPSAVTPNSLLDPLRPGVDLGRVRVRIPHFTLTPISFTAPTVNSSCSSLDLIGGTFSMFSLNEVIAVLRNITSGTLTYALGQSIGALCPRCWSGIQDIQDWMNDISGYAVNSCAIAQEMGGKIADSMGKARCSIMGEYNTLFDDQNQCETEEANDSQTIVDNAARAESKTEKQTFGNVVYQSLESFGSEKKIPFVQDMFVSSMTDREFIMNLIGTVIIDTEDINNVPAMITPELFSNLVIGTEIIENNTNKAWICDGTKSNSGGTMVYACMDTKPISNTGNITPLGKVVKDLLVDDSNSIYKRLITANETGSFNYLGMSNAQVKLINYVDTNVASAMFFMPNPQSTSAQQMFNQIADMVRYDIGQQFYNATLNRLQETPVLLGKKNDMPEINNAVVAAIEKLSALSIEASEKRDEAISVLLESDIYKESIRKYNTSRELSEANN